MAYDIEALKVKAVKYAKSKPMIFFHNQIYAHLGIDRGTYYAHQFHKYDDLKEALTSNRVVQKEKLLTNWAAQEKIPVMQMALYKLIGSESERKKLSQSYHDLTTDGDKIQTGNLDLSDLTKEELLVLRKLNERNKPTQTPDD